MQLLTSLPCDQFLFWVTSEVKPPGQSHNTTYGCAIEEYRTVVVYLVIINISVCCYYVSRFNCLLVVNCNVSVLSTVHTAMYTYLRVA
jgi:hypothetical protein